MDARRMGRGRREIEAQTAGAEVERRQSGQRIARGAIGARPRLRTGAQADLLVDLLTKTVAEYKRSLTITQNQYSAGTAAQSDVITAEAQVLTPRRSSSPRG